MNSYPASQLLHSSVCSLIELQRVIDTDVTNLKKLGAFNNLVAPKFMSCSSCS